MARMSFWQAMNMALFKKYATFKGRASRAEFWFFFLFCVGLLPISFALDVGQAVFGPWAEELGGLLLLFGLLGCSLPLLAVTVRRFHDIGKPFWFPIVLAVIPVLGWIILVFLLANEGDEGSNRFGPDPRW